jgi:exonuclease V gamma subunit
MQKLEEFRKWIAAVDIRWGRDAAHRKEILTKTLGEKNYLDHGSWEKGLDQLLEALIFCQPMQIGADLFEEFLVALTELQKICFSTKKTLKGWADYLESIADQCLIHDKTDEADQATAQSFQQMLFDLRNSEITEEFPLAVIESLIMRPSVGQIHASHLHAVHFTRIEEGALLGAKAVFLIGMSEENFPRIKIASSLDLLKGKVPSRADRDRYLFLQALFSAEEYLRISYCHLSEDEGKPVSASLVVQELLSSLDLEPTVCRFAEETPISKTLIWPKRSRVANACGATIQISELRRLARHPWKFFLQKVHGIYLKDSLEETFALQKGKLLSESLQKPLDQSLLPPGAFGEALKLEIEEKARRWKELIAEWQIEPCTVVLRENCSKAQWEGMQYIAPALEVDCEGMKIRLVGEIQQGSLKGLICSRDDNIAGLLKVWPEALIMALSVNAPHVWMLKSGKTKNLSNIEESLSAFISYYFQSLAAPSPLLPDWADPLLRKRAEDLQKKMEKGSTLEDPVMQWVLARTEEMSAEEIFADWAPTLQTTFKDLIQLYPTRGKTDAKV